MDTDGHGWTQISRRDFQSPFRHWEINAMLCRQTRASGKRVADVLPAAVAMEHGCPWVTRDDDFAAFGPHGLEWEHLVPAEAPDC